MDATQYDGPYDSDAGDDIDDADAHTGAAPSTGPPWTLVGPPTRTLADLMQEIDELRNQVKSLIETVHELVAGKFR